MVSIVGFRPKGCISLDPTILQDPTVEVTPLTSAYRGTAGAWGTMVGKIGMEGKYYTFQPGIM